MAEDAKGVIWAGTERGAASHDGGAWTRRPECGADLVLSVEVDRQDTIWLGTYRSGVVVFDGQRAKSTSSKTRFSSRGKSRGSGAATRARRLKPTGFLFFENQELGAIAPESLSGLSTPLLRGEFRARPIDLAIAQSELGIRPNGQLSGTRKLKLLPYPADGLVHGLPQHSG